MLAPALLAVEGAVAAAAVGTAALPPPLDSSMVMRLAQPAFIAEPAPAAAPADAVSAAQASGGADAMDAAADSAAARSAAMQLAQVVRAAKSSYARLPAAVDPEAIRRLAEVRVAGGDAASVAGPATAQPVRPEQAVPQPMAAAAPPSVSAAGLSVATALRPSMPAQAGRLPAELDARVIIALARETKMPVAAAAPQGQPSAPPVEPSMTPPAQPETDAGVPEVPQAQLELIQEVFAPETRP
jgi:hypothetical protein